VYVTQSGEWKLFGFEVMSSMKEESPFVNVGKPNLLNADSYTNGSIDIWKYGA
jgi:hypothetical protein